MIHGIKRVLEINSSYNEASIIETLCSQVVRQVVDFDQYGTNNYKKLPQEKWTFTDNRYIDCPQCLKIKYLGS